MTVIELDRDLAARLRRVPGLEVLEADVLRVDFAALAASHGDARLRIVGNLPYNISTPILFHLLGAIDVVADQHVMLQKEVAERMAAAPGVKAYGRLSVMLQWRYEIETVLDVPAFAFDPPPQVESTVLRMMPKPAAPGVDAALLGELVSVAFSQRRKLLRHTLGRWLEARDAGATSTCSGAPKRCRWRNTCASPHRCSARRGSSQAATRPSATSPYRRRCS